MLTVKIERFRKELTPILEQVAHEGAQVTVVRFGRPLCVVSAPPKTQKPKRNRAK